MSGPAPATSNVAEGLLNGTSFRVVEAILSENPEIETVHLISYEEGPNWRTLDAVSAGQVTLSLKGLEQDRGSRIHNRFERSKITQKSLQEISRELGAGRLLAIASDVHLHGGTVAHIPMMDFMCPVSAPNQAALSTLLKQFCHGQGYLLESGRSYHYYGSQLLHGNEWPVFLGKCLLMSGFADDRYIGHQLVDRHCVLRLSSGKLKSAIPRLVAQF